MHDQEHVDNTHTTVPITDACEGEAIQDELPYCGLSPSIILK